MYCSLRKVLASSGVTCCLSLPLRVVKPPFKGKITYICLLVCLFICVHLLGVSISGYTYGDQRTTCENCFFHSMSSRDPTPIGPLGHLSSLKPSVSVIASCVWVLVTDCSKTVRTSSGVFLNFLLLIVCQDSKTWPEPYFHCLNRLLWKGVHGLQVISHKKLLSVLDRGI